jgi:hypothetical protein
MRRFVVPILTVAATALIAGADVARARPGEAFTLEAGDKMVAESPGCYAQCVVSGQRRTCTLKGLDCKVSCLTLPECKPDGLRPIKVCATVHEQP